MSLLSTVTRPQLGRALLIAAGALAVTGATVVALGRAGRSAPIAAPAIQPPAPIATAPAAPSVPATPAATAPAPVRSRELMLAFDVDGTTFMKLAAVGGDSGLAIPRHGALHAYDDEVRGVVAKVALRDVPKPYARWLGRTVKLDNTCAAKVVGFSVVSRLVGDPGYANVELSGDAEGDAAWTPRTLLSEGRPMLAARLAPVGAPCTGTYARDASLPDVDVPTTIQDPALERSAIAALMASDAARETQRSWTESIGDGSSHPPLWQTDATITAEVLRFARTGATFVIARGQVSGGCGDPSANVMGVYRLAGDQLQAVHVGIVQDLDSLEAVLDIDGDGELELIGRPWLAVDRVVVNLQGDVIEQLGTPFYGCPC